MRVNTTILRKESVAASQAEGFDSEKNFVVIGVCSDSSPDSHHHVVHKDLLKKYEQALKTEKIPLIAYHDLKMPLGKSFDAYMQNDNGVVGKWVVPRNWNYGVDTNEFIKGVESGALDSLSVGSRIRDMRCMVKGCEKHAFLSRAAEHPSQKCFQHLPGRVYKGETAHWDIRDGYIFEVSSVTSGANYNAKFFDQTKQMAEEAEFMKSFELGHDGMDLLMPFIDDVSELLKSAYDPNKRTFFLPNPEPGGEPEGDEIVELKEQVAVVIGQASATFDNLPKDHAEALEHIVTEAQKAVKECTTLKAEAAANKEKLDAYEAFTNEKINEALKSGVQAEGEKFDKDAWEKILKGYGDLLLVEKQKSIWDEQADDELDDQEGGHIDHDDKSGKSKKSKKGADDDQDDDHAIVGESWEAYLQ